MCLIDKVCCVYVYKKSIHSFIFFFFFFFSKLGYIRGYKKILPQGTVTVCRDKGIYTEIDPRELVNGDVVKIRNGQKVQTTFP